VESAGVVNLIDNAWNIGGDDFECFVIHQIDGLDLKGLHETLDLGIVIGIATSAHGADETMFGQEVAIGLGSVLRTTIRVVDTALRRLSYSNRRLQCRNSRHGVTRRQELRPDNLDDKVICGLVTSCAMMSPGQLSESAFCCRGVAVHRDLSKLSRYLPQREHPSLWR
jgi:hypothetical protein